MFRPHGHSSEYSKHVYSVDKGVVYKIPCHDCEVSYIGETKSTLEKRIQEHMQVCC